MRVRNEREGEGWTERGAARLQCSTLREWRVAGRSDREGSVVGRGRRQHAACFLLRADGV